MVWRNGKVPNGGGGQAHRAGYQESQEVVFPCITRKMTPEERKQYGLDPEEEEEEEMAEKRGKRISTTRMRELIQDGYSAAEIATELNVEEELIWERAKAYGLIRKLQANEPEEESEEESEESVDADEELPDDMPEDEPEEESENGLPDYPQSPEPNEYRYISPRWLDAMAEGLTDGAKHYPGETWRNIPAKEHMARAMRHINLWREGDRDDNHIINASMRLMMAFEMALTEESEAEEDE